MNETVIIGGSAGSFRIIRRVAQELEGGFPFQLIVCVHRLRTLQTGFTEVLSKNLDIDIYEPSDKEPIEAGKIYVAPSNYHLLIEPGGLFTLSSFRRVHHSRPSLDLTMESAAMAFGRTLTGILLSGANADGAGGMASIQEKGGTTIVQDPSNAEIPTMPQSALEAFTPDFVLPAEKIITFIVDKSKIR